MKDEPLGLDPEFLKRAHVQLNTRIPLNLRVRLDQYQEYMKQPFLERRKETQDWPSSLAGIVVDALNTFLRDHPQRLRTGPVKDPEYYIKSKITPKE